MDNGWITLHRKIKDHWIFADPEKLKAWITVLLECNHSDKKVSLGDFLYHVKRGESINSLETWARLFGWSKSKVRRFFVLLSSDSMIETKATHNTTHLTVCNYGAYQDMRHGDEPKMKQTRHKLGTNLAPNNKDNNGNNEQQFNKFYSSYPKKVGKAQALKRFISLKVDDDLFEAIMSALENHKKIWDDPQFIPHPATWLNQKRWEDVLKVETHSIFDDLED